MLALTIFFFPLYAHKTFTWTINFPLFKKNNLLDLQSFFAVSLIIKKISTMKLRGERKGGGIKNEMKQAWLITKKINRIKKKEFSSVVDKALLKNLSYFNTAKKTHYLNGLKTKEELFLKIREIGSFLGIYGEGKCVLYASFYIFYIAVMEYLRFMWFVMLLRVFNIYYDAFFVIVFKNVVYKDWITLL